MNLLLFIGNIKSNIDIKTFEVPENFTITDQDPLFAFFGIYSRKNLFVYNGDPSSPDSISLGSKPSEP